MTTIAYRNGVMAGDSRAFGFDKYPVGQKTKVYRLPDGGLFGISAAKTGVVKRVREWIEDGTRPENKPSPWCEEDDFQAIIVRPDGKCVLVSENFLPSDPVEAEFYAIGSGKELALGAMAAGLDAPAAVRVACKFDPWSAEPVYQVRHESE